MIQDVFINLLDNVVKFTPIFIYVDHDQYHVLISIEDFGPGIFIEEYGLIILEMKGLPFVLHYRFQTKPI